ncbi:hypothetical protein [Deinococcus sp. SL84]|uniref:hypothetical protein n=1 Tax=Deinococcus sp. SL84 TaxID=2994663 RepID=UPI002273039E|nr:hypothetical protein [Deinococcus sp. SL84]MCY1703711.1 hypothetical protein [Deinococcus sp. SL84]
MSDSLHFHHPALPDIALTLASAVTGASPEATALVAVAESVRLLVTSRRQQQLEKALSARINLLAAEYQSLAVCLNSEYVRSEAFASHFLQALRAVEVAEQREKVEFIAAAVLGCAIQPSGTAVNRQMCLRIIEQATFEELEYLFGIMSDGRFTRIPEGIKQEGEFVETEANTLMVRGLVQLGLLSGRASTWGGSNAFRPTILAEHIVLLCQETDPFGDHAV